MAHVRRYKRRVGVHLGNGNRTVYLLPGEAKAIASAISRCAADIKATPDGLGAYAGKDWHLEDEYNEGKS